MKKSDLVQTVTVDVVISVATVITMGLEGNWEMMVVICWDFTMI